eukprot:g1841.t1
MQDIALFCNAYPSIDVNFNILGGNSVSPGEDVVLKVVIEREYDEDDPAEIARLGQVVCSPRFKKDGYKTEAWWLVVGQLGNSEEGSNKLLGITRFSFKKSKKAKVSFEAPKSVGKHELVLFLMCDSYIGVDQEFKFTLDVQNDNDIDDDDSSMMKEE